MYGIKVVESKTSFNPFVMAEPDEVAARIVRILNGEPMLVPADNLESSDKPKSE